MNKKIKWIFFAVLLAGMCFLGKKEVLYAQDISVKEIKTPWDIPAVAAEINTDTNQIKEKLSKVVYTLYTEEEVLRIPVTWETSGVNMKVRGTYLIKGKLVLPQGYFMEEGVQAEPVQTVVSVQSRDMPDINAYYRLTAAGLYIFPWLERSDADTMSVYLKKDGGDWVNLTEEELAMCDAEGLYLSNQSLIVGNTYSLTVKYETGQSKILRFALKKGGELEIYSYQTGLMGESAKPVSCIRSYDTKSESFLKRCGAYAVAVGDKEKLETILEELTSDIKLDVCTDDSFQISSEHPLIVLRTTWDVSEVKLNREGVYRLTGTFEIPEGYTVDENLQLPQACAYISVQKKGEPQINTYSMPSVDLAEFPVLFEGFDRQQLEKMQIYLKKDQGAYRKLSKEEVQITSTGIELACRRILKKGSTYSLCIVYEQGSTGIYTFEYNDDFLVNDYWHERNFSDREEKELPDIIQSITVTPQPNPAESVTPAPDSVQTPQESDQAEPTQLPQDSENQKEETESEIPSWESGYTEKTGTTGASAQTVSSAQVPIGQPGEGTAAVTVTEKSTDTVTVISGQRLLLMIEQNGSARFEKQGISLNLSQKDTENWKIRAEDEIQVMIEKVSEKAFSVHIFVRGEEITDLLDSYVEFPASAFDLKVSPQELTVQDAEGAICAQSYQQEQETIQVEIKKTGDYFLVTEETAEETVSSVVSQDEEDMTDVWDTDFLELPEETGASPEEEIQKTEKDRNFLPVTAAGTVFAVFALVAGIRKKRKHEKKKK